MLVSGYYSSAFYGNPPPLESHRSPEGAAVSMKAARGANATATRTRIQPAREKTHQLLGSLDQEDGAWGTGR